MNKINTRRLTALFSLFIFVFLFSFVFVEAQQVPVTPEIVPDSCAAGKPCSFCDLYLLVVNVMKFLVALAIPLATLFIAWGGIQILTASGPGSVSRGWDIVKNALIGIVFVFGAWLIVNTFISLLVTGDFQLPWKEFNC